MAKQRKILPARRNDDSLLIRSAESLGRMIGSLQRELDAARQLTVRDGDADGQGDGHAPARKRTAKSKSAATPKNNSRALAGANQIGGKQIGGKRIGGKQGAAKADRVKSKQQRDRRARESGK